MTADPNRCPSRIAHESGAVRRCLRIHDPIEQPWHEAGDATWLDGDDRVLAELDRASAEHVKRGDLLDMVLDTGEEHRLVVVDDPKVGADGTVTFEAADPALGVTEVRSDAEVLRIAAAQADARRARAEHAAVDIRPLSVTELVRERLGRQVARQAERRGQLDGGGV